MTVYKFLARSNYRGRWWITWYTDDQGIVQLKTVSKKKPGGVPTGVPETGWRALRLLMLMEARIQ